MKRPAKMLTCVRRYLAYRRSLGYALRAEGQLLLDFGRYADRIGHRGGLTLKLALEWARLPTQADPGYWARRLQAVRCLAKYIALFEPQTVVPPTHLVGRAFIRRVPHIYSTEELAHLLGAALSLPPSGSLRPHTQFTLIGLLACTGMRVGEALRLNVDDVDLQAGTITVWRSKLHEVRVLPLHATTVKQLARYHRQRCALFPEAKAFFVSERGTSLRIVTVEDTFRRLVTIIKGRGSRLHPRLTDLRHTFSCRVLLRWRRRQQDLDHHLLLLMHYLGHSKIRDTYWYLTGVPELFRQAATTFESRSPLG
jgi:integrase